MKYKLPLLLLLIISIQSFSQRHNRDYQLSAEVPKPSEKNGQTVWTVKTTLSNNTKDTLYYFSTIGCEAAYYSVDTNVLYVNFAKCDSGNQTVISIPPHGQRTTEIEIGSHQALVASVPFKMILFLFKAKNAHERKAPGTLGKASASL